MKIFPNEIVPVANEIVLQNLLSSYSGIDNSSESHLPPKLTG